MATDSTTTSEAYLSAAQIYDSVGPAYEQAFAHQPAQEAAVSWLLQQLAPRKPGTFLDIGCGTGKPVVAAVTAAGHDAIGIDMAASMLEAARANVPGARFEQVDIRDFSPELASLDAITAQFSLIVDMTPAGIREILAQIFALLKPGGVFVLATLTEAIESEATSWMGRHCVASGLDVQDTLGTLRKVGFGIEYQDTTVFMPKAVEAGICKEEDNKEETHLWVYARKPVD